MRCSESRGHHDLEGGLPPEALAGTRAYHQGRQLSLDEFAIVRTGVTGDAIRNFEYDFAFPYGPTLTLLANSPP
jgi:hypothetical protein